MEPFHVGNFIVAKTLAPLPLLKPSLFLASFPQELSPTASPSPELHDLVPPLSLSSVLEVSELPLVLVSCLSRLSCHLELTEALSGGAHFVNLPLSLLWQGFH